MAHKARHNDKEHHLQQVKHLLNSSTLILQRQTAECSWVKTMNSAKKHFSVLKYITTQLLCNLHRFLKFVLRNELYKSNMTFFLTTNLSCKMYRHSTYWTIQEDVQESSYANVSRCGPRHSGEIGQ